MKGRSRAEYVRDKIVYHLARFAPEVRADILIEVARELAAIDAGGRTVGDADVDVRVRPKARETLRALVVSRRNQE
jgi:hypothetical protein